MKILGIIPARGGSKRVPRKNIKDLGGLPLIAYTIKAVKDAKFIADCIVSTEDEEIAAVAQKHGANVPFVRPVELSGNQMGDRPVLIHALETYEALTNLKFDAICLLRPTSPFRTGALIDAGIQKLIETKADSVRSMTKVEGVHHPYWMFQEENGKAKGVVPGISIETYYQSQLLPPVFRLNGCVDLIRKENLRDENGPLYGENMAILETPEKESIDIDTPEDFAYCEWLINEGLR
ncbi:MAG: cytidylyltransferase domain-containing protein [Crocinitomicaceae bacterium]